MRFALTHFVHKNQNEILVSARGIFRPMKELKATAAPKITLIPGKSADFELGTKVYYIFGGEKYSGECYCELGFSLRKNENEENAETRFSWGLGGKITVK